jgi:hypothetical protein
MKDPKKFVSRQFILSFFPLLNFVSIKKDPYVDYYHFGTDIPDLQNSSEDFEEETSKTSEYEYLSSASNYDSEDDSVEMLDQEEKKFLKEFQESINLRSSNPSNVLLVDNRDQELNSKYDDETDNNFIESIKAGMGNSGEKFKTNKCEEPETEGILDGNYCQVINPEETQPVGNNNPEILFRDDLFHQMFGTNNAEFEDLDHLGEAINEYESLTANRLATVKGEKVKQYRRYVCKQHIGCSFYASFGLRYNSQKIILKRCNMDHCGKLSSGYSSKDGRADKTRRKGMLNDSISTVLQVKASCPNPSDVVKTSQSMHGHTTSYDQAWRSLNVDDKIQQKKNLQSYQLIGPYLRKFAELNPHSGINYEIYPNGQFARCFVMPALMQSKLCFVRPVISLDACHLRSKAKGTLYTATVLSAANEIYPIAFAITKDNENHDGWTFFLENLKQNCSIITEPHWKERCSPYVLFSFISDRDKGLVSAMRNVFPNSLHTNCLFHISKNVQNKWKKVPWRLIFNIGKSFDLRTEILGFEELNKLCPEAVDYCLDMDPKLWRCTEWTRNGSLPPRYCMYTSNISESTNAMFEEARDLPWLYTIDSILNIMTRRHDRLFNKWKDFKDSKEVVPEVQVHMKKLFDASGNFEVIQINDSSGEYKINRSAKDLQSIGISHCINIKQQSCTCGKWQDREYPCIDALAYFRNYKRLSFHDILEKHVSPYYSCNSLFLLWRKNICPVIISTLEHDETAQPPLSPERVKRQTGRPRMKRFRNRSKYPDPKDSKVICKKCTKPGHNSRTCDIRKIMEAIQEELKKKAEMASATVVTNKIDVEADDGTGNKNVSDPIVNEVAASLVNGNNISISNSVSVECIKALDPGYKTNIM